jgi:hypothetical protein
MSQETFVGTFVVLGLISGALAGWIISKIGYDLDCKWANMSYKIGMTTAVQIAIIALAAYHHFVIVALASVVLAPLVYFLSGVFLDFTDKLTIRNPSSQYYSSSSSDSTQGQYYFGSFIGAFTCLLAAGFAAAFYGWLGGLLAVSVGSVIIPCAALGFLYWCLAVFTVIGNLGYTDTARWLTAIGGRISARITSR